ncbi:MAG: sodium:solute symporter [Planctomycetaceae bacterium]|nr:sodium:solute symporter [Planctomycetaceae bacterium]
MVSGVDIGVVVVYLLAVTWIGCRLAGKTRTSRDFMTAGGGLPGWVVGLSIVGTFVSSISFIGNPGKTFSGNWNPFVFSLSLPYAALVATVFFVPWFREGDSCSAYERLEQRFGTWARVYAALFNVLYHIGRVGVILFAVSVAVSALLDVPLPILIVGLGVLVVVYTLLGGIEAVIWTDVVQSCILVGGTLVCAGLLLWKIEGGLSGVLTTAAADSGRFSLGSMGLDFSQRSFWMMLVFGFFINVQNFAADQTYVQRYFTAASTDAARRSVWLGAIAYLPISAVLFFIGSAMFVYYTQTGTLPEGTVNDAVLPYFIATELPTGVAGLLVAAILAAAMSTVDSSLSSSATLLLCDVRNLFRQRYRDEPIVPAGPSAAEDAADLRFLRLTTVVLGIAGVGAAIAMINSKQMLDVWWRISGTLSGGTLGLLLLARFTRVRGALAPGLGVMAGIVVITAVSLIPHGSSLASRLPGVAWLHEHVDPLMGIVLGTLTVVLTCLAVAAVRPVQR